MGENHKNRLPIVMWTRNLCWSSTLTFIAGCCYGSLYFLLRSNGGGAVNAPCPTTATADEKTSPGSSKCCQQGSWTKRGSIIRGSRPHTQAGTSVAISNDGRVVCIEEYGASDGPYITNGTGTGRLRLLQWDDAANDWRDVQSFMQGLTQDMTLSGDGLVVSTIGHNITNDSIDGEVDLIVEVHARASWSSPMVPRGPAFSKTNGLRYFPTQQALSIDGTTLALSGLTNDNNIGDDATSQYQVYRYGASSSTGPNTAVTTNTGGAVTTWSQLGNNIVSVGSMVVMALSADGTTLATLGLKVNTDYTSCSLIGQVWDYQQSSSYSSSSTSHALARWTQRGENITITIDPVDLVDMFNFAVKLSDGGDVFVIFASEKQDKQQNQQHGTTKGNKKAFIHPYIYHRNAGWVPRGPKLRGDAAYGTVPSLAMSGDANVIAVGSVVTTAAAALTRRGEDDVYDGNNSTEDANVPYLNIFRFDGSQYVVQQQIIGGGFPVGAGLAISTDGTHIVSADMFDGGQTGAVQVLRKCNGSQRRDVGDDRVLPPLASIDKIWPRRVFSTGLTR